MGLSGLERRLGLRGDISTDFLKTGFVSGFSTATTGIKTVAETFSTPFPNSIDGVWLQPYEITDPTNVELGFAEPSAMCVSSFVGVVKVTASGIAGSTLKLKYLSLGD